MLGDAVRETLPLLRSHAESLMVDRATIQRKTSTRTPTGGYADSWADVSTVPCRVRPVSASSPQEETVASRLQTDTPAVVVVPVGTDVGTEDRIVIDGTVYEVGGLVLGSLQTSLPVVCKVLA